MKDLYRGNHKLPHQSQVLGRDLDAEEIKRHPGAQCFAYRLTERQRKEDRWQPYEFIVYSPEGPALSWIAFENKEGLAAWLDAYDLVADPPNPGDSFKVLLPN